MNCRTGHVYVFHEKFGSPHGIITYLILGPGPSNESYENDNVRWNSWEVLMTTRMGHVEKRSVPLLESSIEMWLETDMFRKIDV